MREVSLTEIQRPQKEKKYTRLTLLGNDIDQMSYKNYWWGMPSYEMGDATPAHKVTFNFLTAQDLKDFSKKIGIKLTEKSNSAWYPPQPRIHGEYSYEGELIQPRYPIYIPSKGRFKNQTTGTLLRYLGVKFKFVVEPSEAQEYINRFGQDSVLVLPFQDLGQGSIPARNWIWDHAKSIGAKRHWCLDDNIESFCRCNMNRRLLVKTGAVLCAIEDWTDRYKNVALAGPHHLGFVPDRDEGLSPILLNSRIYSCILIDTSLDYRWRGRYNEDTDLSLRVLKDGYITALFRALLMKKADTQTMSGGNTDNVYNTGDSRLAFAKSLEEQHPDVVKVIWKFNRWHHKVNYKPFAGNKLILRDCVTPVCSNNEYGMKLIRRG